MCGFPHHTHADTAAGISVELVTVITSNFTGQFDNVGK